MVRRCGEHHALLADRFNGCRGIRDTTLLWAADRPLRRRIRSNGTVEKFDLRLEGRRRRTRPSNPANSQLEATPTRRERPRGRREIDRLRLPLHLAHHWGSASAEIPPLERLKCRKNASKVRAENACYRLKPYASTSRKGGSPNVRGCCFERAAKAEPTSPSRRSSRRPYPLSAPGLAGGWRASRAPQADTFRPMPTGSRSAPRRCAPRCITASDGWKCLRVDAISIESCDWWSVQLTSTACADYDAQCRPRQRDRP